MFILPWKMEEYDYLQADSFVPEFRSKEAFTRMTKKGGKDVEGGGDFNAYKIGEIFRNKFPTASDAAVRNLKQQAEKYDLEHRNLSMMAVAIYIVLTTYLKKGILTPELFQTYYKQFSSLLTEESQRYGKKEISHMSYQVLLYNYIDYVIKGDARFERILP